MPLPPFDPTRHDIGIAGVGYLRAPDAQIQRQDLVPATSRAALGEGRYDSYQSESFVAQAEFSGGAGQRRLVDTSSYLTGYGDSRWGPFFPPKRQQSAPDGGTTSYFFARDETLYGLTESAIETIGSAASVARPAGTPLHRPVVSGTSAAFWVQGSTLYKWSGSGSPTDITPAGITPYVAERYGKWMWLLGKRTRPSAISVVQSRVASARNRDNLAVGWSQPTVAGNTLIAIVWSKGANRTLDSLSSTGWQLAGSSNDSASFGAIEVLVMPGAESRSGSEMFTFDAVATDCGVALIEVAGLRLRAVVDVSSSATDTDTGVTSTSVTGASTTTGTLAQSKAIVIRALAANDSAENIAIDTGGGWTLVGAMGGVSHSWSTATGPSKSKATVAYQIVSATTSVTGTASINRASAVSGTVGSGAVVVALKGTELTADTDQFVMLYSNDDGASWTEVTPTTSTGIGRPLAAWPAYGFLWFTTATGLYQMSAEERTFADQTEDVLVGLREVDRWSLPYDAGAAGTQVVAWDGLVYWNVGSTIRRYAPGGSASQVFPNERWATVTGKIQGMTAGEGGIYFGCGGYLWCYNGRGLHPLAREGAPGTFDALHWHQGRLYCKGDPARYVEFRYPSSRPDLALTAPDTFETGYVVLSEIDFDKVSEYKVINAFQLQGYFTGGATAAESGTLTLDYVVADAGAADPGRLGGGATSLPWVTVGSLSVADGGTKTFTLATPVVAKRLYLRVTLTPGSVGYPVLLAPIAYGRAVMPSAERIVAGLKLFTGQRDKRGEVVYATDADVKAAVDALRALRRATNAAYFTVEYVDEIGGVETYTMTAEAMANWLAFEKQQAGISYVAQFSMVELPR